MKGIGIYMIEDKRVEKRNKATDYKEALTQSDVKKKFNFKRELLSWVIIIAIAYICAKLVTNYVIIKSIIPTESMENTVMKNDKIVGNRLAYLFSSPERGDIVIFKYPDDESQNYLKRVIGLPGETVEIKEGSVYIYNASGELIEGPLEEPYLKEEMYTEGILSYTVPENSYFMLGDNRNVSKDSRYWENTFVKKDKILAKAWFRYSPNLSWLK